MPLRSELLAAAAPRLEQITFVYQVDPNSKLPGCRCWDFHSRRCRLYRTCDGCLLQELPGGRYLVSNSVTTPGRKVVTKFGQVARQREIWSKGPLHSNLW